jgi:phage repressor protein C with HTH and peptisase S24 domain
MLTHSRIWTAIDALAQAQGLSTSGLARKAGLDPTTFNKSKRISGDGKLRWPSTESIAKILDVTRVSLLDFTRLVDTQAPAPNDTGEARKFRVPVIGYAQAGQDGFFDDLGYPKGVGWDEVEFPDLPDPNAYGLEISGDSMEPMYRDGDIIVVSPRAQIRRGDRIVLKTKAGEIMAKELVRQTANRIELRSLNPAHPPRSLAMEDIGWIGRILWVSQ